MTCTTELATVTGDPNRFLSGQTGPDAVRRAIEARTLSPGFQRVALAFLRADEAYQAPARAHNTAEKAVFSAKREKHSLPIPDALTFRKPARTCTNSDDTIALGASSFTLTKREDIVRHFKGDEVAAASALAALAAWEQRRAEVDEASGWAAAVRREEEARELEEAANNTLSEAQMAMLCHPTVHLADLEVKRVAVAEFIRTDHMEPVAAVLEATLTALRTAKVCLPDPEIARAWDEAIARPVDGAPAPVVEEIVNPSA